MTYPQTAGYVAHSRTSQAAAESLRMESMERRVRDLLKAIGKDGATADELHPFIRMTNKWRNTSVSTVAARLRGLELKGEAVKLDETKETCNGKQAFVWVLKENAAGRQLAPTKESESPRTAYEIHLLKENATLTLRLENALITIESLERRLA